MKAKMNQPVKALIAVRSTERRDALHALLESLNCIDAICLADDVQTSIETINRHRPALVLVDFNLSDAVSTPGDATIIVLVADRAEQERARSTGAMQVFIEGTPVSQLVAAIESLLKTREGK